MITFKQFLSELMVDLDPSEDPTQQMMNVRKTQLLAKRSPVRALKAQSDQNKQALAAATASSTPSSSLEAQIARKKDEIYRLEQRLVKLKQQEENKQKAAGALPGAKV